MKHIKILTALSTLSCLALTANAAENLHSRQIARGVRRAIITEERTQIADKRDAMAGAFKDFLNQLLQSTPDLAHNISTLSAADPNYPVYVCSEPKFKNYHDYPVVQESSIRLQDAPLFSHIKAVQKYLASQERSYSALRNFFHIVLYDWERVLQDHRQWRQAQDCPTPESSVFTGLVFNDLESVATYFNTVGDQTTVYSHSVCAFFTAGKTFLQNNPEYIELLANDNLSIFHQD